MLMAGMSLDPNTAIRAVWMKESSGMDAVTGLGTDWEFLTRYQSMFIFLHSCPNGLSIGVVPMAMLFFCLLVLGFVVLPNTFLFRTKKQCMLLF